MANITRKITRAHPGFQEKFVSSNVDFVIGGGSAGGGKTFAALLMAAEHASDPNFRMVFIRKNISDTKIGGGGVDEAQKIYGHIAQIKVSDSPRLTFPSGAFIDFTHMADQDPASVEERVKGWQYSCIYIDEATAQEWSTIRILFTRNRSGAKWSGKFRVTCNPKKRHWLRRWVDWYVDDDGDPMPERDGVVRYFYINGDEIGDVVFGATKEEVYRQCQSVIDTALAKVNSHSERIYTYRDIIKSYTFYGGNVAENKSLLKNDPGYIGSLAAMGERQSKAYLLGNWNVDEDDDLTPIKRDKARELADNDPCRNGEKWLTVDLADTGTDNCIMLTWDGLHVTDCEIIEKSTPAANCTAIARMTAKHGIGENHIIYDAQRAAYMIDYFPNAMPYMSFKAATGLYSRLGERLKDITYLRLAELINNNRMSIAPDVAGRNYTHQNIKRQTTLLEEVMRECAVVNFDTTPSGKYKLWGKKAMNRMLGRQSSMDVLDCIAMRLYPLCGCEYGKELSGPASSGRYSEDYNGPDSIYDDSNWF